MTYTSEELQKILADHKLWVETRYESVPKGKRANLSHADLNGAYLTNANLHGANLNGAYLKGANLIGANLNGAYLNGVKGLDIPIVPDLDAHILSIVETGCGEIKMETWHSCETAHCRAGWAVELAGEEGAKLENMVGSAVAGALIYAASCPTLPIPNFYSTNEECLADLRKRCE